MLRHPSCPILSNPICAFTSEDNMMRHPELIFVGNSLELGKEAPFFPVSQSQPSVETLTDTSFCYSVKSFWAGQVSSFLSFSVKNKQKSSFFPSWMPSLVCSPDPKKSQWLFSPGILHFWLWSRRKGHQAAGHCSVWRAWMMKSLLPEKEIY